MAMQRIFVWIYIYVCFNRKQIKVVSDIFRYVYMYMIYVYI